MAFFKNLISKSRAYKDICEAIEKGNTPISVTGVSDIHKAHLAAALCEKGGSLLICRNEVQARQMTRDINSMLGSNQAAFYPERDLCYDLAQTSSREYEQERLSALWRLFKGEIKILVASVSAAMQYTLPPKKLEESCFSLKSSQSISIDEICTRLISGGYVRRSQIDGTGQFSLRGGILDIFCPAHTVPYRIEFWGDEIDSIAPFDISTQRRGEGESQITVTPARENLFDRDELITRLRAAAEKIKNDEQKSVLLREINFISDGNECCFDKFMPFASFRASVFDYVSGLVFVSELSDIHESAKGFLERQALEQGEITYGLEHRDNGYSLTPAELFYKIEKNKSILMDAFSRSFSVLQPKKFIVMRASHSGCFSGKPSSLPDQLSQQLEGGYTAVICTPTQQLSHILCSDLTEAGISCVAISACDAISLAPKTVYITCAALSASFDYPEEKITVISFQGAGAREKKKRKNKAVFDLSSVSVGDYVVHSAHGIGIYKGIQKLEVQGIIKDYLKIQYGGSDVLYVPVTQLDMVAKYIGAAADDNIKLSRLNSAVWKNTKSRVSRAVRDMAQELTALYAKRMQAKGFAFSEDSDWQSDFEARFPYEETPDQIRCTQEIKEDMESSVPMDRILCGDVGFGKTEVALRAAMKCVMDSKQCAILVPTTILAWQHYKTALSRFDSFPINIALLSGFRSKKEQCEILKKLERGEIDIIIGTHRLISRDVVFKDLGLAIIDEEQRFGVAHKEKFKELFAGVDMLTLSATPIPRTLNMAMSGIRDISMIEEAPIDRYPVQTFVLEYNRALLLTAIERELSRGGQVYYLHNRVETINQKAAAIAQAIPNCTVAVAHGQLSPSELENVWKRLVDHEIDVLVCTTIIETGVDVSNCNTMIIEDADHMGLSQLYQLRGRIGRSSRRAYAYFTFRPGKEISEVASKRLSAIRDFTAFGSGFQIALRDLEIRGAGNMLGAQQHGHMDAVGYDMYLKLLNEAIAEQKGEAPVEAEECLIDLPISAHIPNSYIDDNTVRIEIYRRIALIKNDDDAMDVTDELIDRFGEPPREVSLLIAVALLRNLSQKAGILSISKKSDFVVLEFSSPNLRLLSSACAKFPKNVLLSNSSVPYLSVKPSRSIDLLSQLTEIAGFLKDEKEVIDSEKSN